MTVVKNWSVYWLCLDGWHWYDGWYCCFQLPPFQLSTLTHLLVHSPGIEQAAWQMSLLRTASYLKSYYLTLFIVVFPGNFGIA
ncbi:hypothetical protein V6N13_030027 [Hibiscus sabdariffa]